MDLFEQNAAPKERKFQQFLLKDGELLYMPNFMGVYQPVPGAAFTNGFHGFPTRGGGQLLWENSLGRKVTYGCILLHNNNMQQLYNWAEEGVVVEIQA